MFFDVSYDPKYNDDDGIDPITAGQNPNHNNNNEIMISLANNDKKNTRI